MIFQLINYRHGQDREKSEIVKDLIKSFNLIIGLCGNLKDYHVIPVISASKDVNFSA